MSKIKVGEDVNSLISNTRDYISDAITTLESASDKIAFLDLEYNDPAVQNLAYHVRLLLMKLRNTKRRSIRIINEVEA